MSSNPNPVNRTNIILGLIAVFLLVLGTNRIDKSHFKTVQDAITSVYEDRVIAQDYIYKMSLLTRQKEEQYQDNADRRSIIATNETFQNIIQQFSQTKLTIKETEYLSNLRETFAAIVAQENQYFKNNTTNLDLARLSNNAARDLEDLQKELNALAKIQISESKNITLTAQKSLSMNNIISWLEIGILIVIGIIIQYIIFYRVKKKVVKNP